MGRGSGHVMMYPPPQVGLESCPSWTVSPGEALPTHFVVSLALRSAETGLAVEPDGIEMRVQPG